MPKILVLDDQTDILYLMETVLRLHGYEVQTAFSKDKFYELLSSFKPQLVILDVMIGGDDGRDICREIKAAEHKHIPVILYSANPDLLLDFQECHANDVLEKPFAIKDLLSKIEKSFNS